MIKSFSHKGLKKLFEEGKAKEVPADMAKRLAVRLDFLNRATILEDLNLPGFDLHPLKGDRKGTFAISVTGNCRMTFTFKDGQADDVNLEDHH